MVVGSLTNNDKNTLTGADGVDEGTTALRIFRLPTSISDLTVGDSLICLLTSSKRNLQAFTKLILLIVRKGLIKLYGTYLIAKIQSLKM